MGIFLIILVISLVIGLITYAYHGFIFPALFGFVISFICCCVIPVLIIAASYSSYVKIRTQYDATINQYQEAVTMYNDVAKINVDKAFTDFKYQGYQENIAGFIKDLRYKVVSYNGTLISKRIMKKNFFFKWVIIEGDPDMKILSLTKTSIDPKKRHLQSGNTPIGSDERRSPDSRYELYWPDERRYE